MVISQLQLIHPQDKLSARDGSVELSNGRLLFHRKAAPVGLFGRPAETEATVLDIPLTAIDVVKVKSFVITLLSMNQQGPRLEIYSGGLQYQISSAQAGIRERVTLPEITTLEKALKEEGVKVTATNKIISIIFVSISITLIILLGIVSLGLQALSN